MFSFSASDRLLNVRVVPDLLLVAVKLMSSVPKKYRSVRRMAPAAQLWPDGFSGNGGVTSGACPAGSGVAGSNSGVHPGSAVVAGLPSVSASRMAVIGRHEL